MQGLTIAVVLALVGVAVAGIPDYHGHDHYAHPKYKYSYGVNDKHTGDYKTAHGFQAEVINKGGHAHHAPVYAKKAYDAGHGYALGHGQGYAVSSLGGAGGAGFDGGFDGGAGFGGAF
ncbi:Cuticle protein 19 [Folsomia candida]|uniref:Cuticle protein 19 n=1 Tax=Folsomia candida TaxID=158441 RepID=A0A226E2A8_FOLCA|nr:Cuticle protein 19 [Folsomia candida]